MNVNNNSEVKENNLKETQATSAVVQSQTAPVKKSDNSFKEEFDKLLTSNLTLDPSLVMPEINSFDYLSTINFDDFETHTIDTKKIENVDAMFFLNVANQGETVNISLNDELSVIDAKNYKTMEVSKTLGDMLIRAQENNKSLRLDFDNNVTVILKVAADGKIDASFIPQNKEVENYLKNNIDYLKVRFDEQSIAYSNISYKPYKQNKDNRDETNHQRQERQGNNNE